MWKLWIECDLLDAISLSKHDVISVRPVNIDIYLSDVRGLFPCSISHSLQKGKRET